MSKLVIAAAAALGLAAYVFVYATGLADRPIRSDGVSYYVYLPSWFIFHDTTLRELARDCCGGEFPEYTAIIRWPGTRRWVNAHPIGVAILQAPFFIAAHLLTRWSNLSPDGFSFYYQHGAGLAGLFWMIAGLMVLRTLLRRQFSDRVAAATLFGITFATNLFHYGTYDSSYSHVYSFFLFASFMLLTDDWYRRPTRSTPILLGLVAGLIVLTRHTNALFLIVFPLYGMSGVAQAFRPAATATGDGLRARVSQLAARRGDLALIAAAAFVTVLPQLAIYYQATGHFLISSYGSLGFNFTAPALYGVLFSVQKGVFFWSPLLLVAAAGLPLTRGPARALALPGALFLIVNTYIVASWWDWQFGASYGHRGFVDALPVFALGLATLFDRAAFSVRARWIGGCALSLAAALSMFQMYQYWSGVMPMSDTTWEQYRAAFLRLR